jgi:ABC-type transporter Mla MlaB component
MLKLTWHTRADQTLTLELEGELLGPWVEEVREACAGPAVATGLIRLDLSAVTFVDSPGLRLLRDLIRRGIETPVCSGFVAELLRPENLKGRRSTSRPART